MQKIILCVKKSNASRVLRNSLRYRSARVRLDVEELAHRRGYQNGEGTLFSRRINFEAGCAPAPDDSRLIVPIPSHGNGGVRIPMKAKREGSRVEGKQRHISQPDMYVH